MWIIELAVRKIGVERVEKRVKTEESDGITQM